MKKIISIICTAALIAAMSCIGVTAADELVTFTIVPHPVITGATEAVADLVVDVAEGHSITSFGVVLRYDSLKLALKSAESCIEGLSTGSEVISSNPYNWVWVGDLTSDTAADTASITGKTVVATFTFDVRGDEGAVNGHVYEFGLSAKDNGTVLSEDGHNYSAAGEIVFNGAETTVKKAGDVNDDGEYNIQDAICILKHLSGWENAPGFIEAGDVDNSGVTDEDDVVYYLRSIVGWEGYSIG